MRLIVVSFGMVVSGLLCWFNWQPITLYFLGNSSQTALFSFSLPLAAWILLFILAGLITGLLLQIFNQFFVSSVASRRPRPRFDPPSPRQGSFPNPNAPDWEQESFNEWDIEEPPQAPTQPRYTPSSAPQAPKTKIQDSFKPEKPPQQSPSPKDQENPLEPPHSSNFEVPQSPKRTSEEGSVYSYTYQEKSDRPQKSTSDQVYDAPYRVITPPNEKSDDSENRREDDDWSEF